MMLNILISENRRITSNGYNYVVEHRRGRNKDGSVNWRPQKFYTSIAGLLRGLHDERVRESGCESLQELAAEVKAANEWLAAIAEKLAPVTPTRGGMPVATEAV